MRGLHGAEPCGGNGVLPVPDDLPLKRKETRVFKEEGDEELISD